MGGERWEFSLGDGVYLCYYFVVLLYSWGNWDLRNVGSSLVSWSNKWLDLSLGFVDFSVYSICTELFFFGTIFILIIYLVIYLVIVFSFIEYVLEGL